MFYGSQLNPPVGRIPSQGILTFESVGMYTGVQLSNHTGKTVYFMGVDGVVHNLVSRPWYNMIKDSSPKICVRVDARYDSEPINGVCRALNIITNRYDDIYITPVSELYTEVGIPTAVYLPQANVTVSMVPDTNLLRQAHPFLATPIQSDDMLFSRLVINLHDPSKKYFYVAGAHGVSKINVIHELTKPEFIQFRVRDEHGITKESRLDISADVDLRCIDVGYKRFGLVMGLVADMVATTFDELHNQVHIELAETKQQLDNITKELTITKEENALLKKQVTKVVDEHAEINELSSLKMKADIANLDYEKTKARISADIDMLPAKAQRENHRAEMDLAVAHAKLIGAESDNRAQAWKSTAAIAGAAATLGVVATKVMTTSSAAAVAAISAPVSVPIAAVAALGVAVAASSEGVRDNIADIFSSVRRTSSRICSKLGTCVDSTIYRVENAARAVSDSGVRFVRKCVNTAKSVGRSVANAAKSVWSSVSSSISRVSSWFF